MFLPNKIVIRLLVSIGTTFSGFYFVKGPSVTRKISHGGVNFMRVGQIHEKVPKWPKKRVLSNIELN